MNRKISLITLSFLCFSCFRVVTMCPSATYEEIQKDNRRELKKVGQRFNSKLTYRKDSLHSIINFSEFIESGLHSNSELYQTNLFDKKIKKQIPCFLYHGEFINQSAFIFPIYRKEFDERFFQFYTIDRDSTEFKNVVSEAVSLISQISTPYVKKINQEFHNDTITVLFELNDLNHETVLFYTEFDSKNINRLIAKKR